MQQAADAPQLVGDRTGGSAEPQRVGDRPVDELTGAHSGSVTAASSWAARGSGRPLRTRSSIQVSPGTVKDQTSPEAAYSQPIGLADSRRLRISPKTAKPR